MPAIALTDNNNMFGILEFSITCINNSVQPIIGTSINYLDIQTKEHPSQLNFLVMNEEGYINLDGILSGTRSYAPEKLIIGRREFEDVTFAMGKPKESIVYFENDHSWNLEVDEFIDAINGVGVIKEGTFQDAYETLSLVQRVYENSEI
jgi:hypothetical protein